MCEEKMLERWIDFEVGYTKDGEVYIKKGNDYYYLFVNEDDINVVRVRVLDYANWKTDVKNVRIPKHYDILTIIELIRTLGEFVKTLEERFNGGVC